MRSLCLSFACLAIGAAAKPPNVVMIVADDLGWNDIGRHNSNISTPNLDALASQGVFLDQYAVFMTCSPTRASLLTGRIPYHTGIHKPINVKPQAVSLDHTMLPEVLGKVGFKSYLIGKWHLGYHTPRHLPAARGFDTSFGYLQGSEDYWTHSSTCKSDDGTQKFEALDLCTTMPTVDGSASLQAEPNFTGVYSTNMLVDKATSVIAGHVQEQSDAPFFLYMAFQSVHGPCQVPQSYIDKYPEEMDHGRRTFSGMLTALDDAVANLTSALDRYGMLENTLVIFTTDNGGNLKQNGNNWPLRGAKFSMWEGGTRGYAFVYSQNEAIIPAGMRGATVSNIVHAADWFATILDASGNLKALPESAIDSLSMWHFLTGSEGPGRTDLVHGAYGKGGKLDHGKIRSGKYNYYAGYPGLDDWTRVAPEDPDHGEGETACSSDAGCLFDIIADPNERVNLAEDMPEVAAQLRSKLEAAVLDCPDNCESDMQAGDWSSNWHCDSVDKYGCFGPMFDLDALSLVV